MSYQVIARKWRPQTFEEVTGQEAITRTLRNAIDHERLHHAYLFSGARGVGKTTTARLLAKALNCHKTDKPNPKPCSPNDAGACASCVEIAEGRSIDVLEIDAASTTGVQNVRDTIIDSLGISPARDRYKIFIIDEVHQLSKQAFDALLKTLEEPPPRVMFIMATTELHKVPDTILSRCQEFEFRTIAAAKIFERLKLIADAEKINITDESLREISRAGEGSMRDAQSAFDQVISFSGERIELQDVATALGIASSEMLSQTIVAIAAQNAPEILRVVEELTHRGQDLRNFCRQLLAHFRDLLVAKIAPEGEELFDSAILSRAELASQNQHFTEADLIRFFNSLSETETQLPKASNPRYALEIGLIKLIEMRRVTSIEKILERLAGLENAFANGSAPPLSKAAPQNSANLSNASKQINLTDFATVPPDTEKKTLIADFPFSEVPFPVAPQEISVVLPTENLSAVAINANSFAAQTASSFLPEISFAPPPPQPAENSQPAPDGNFSVVSETKAAPFSITNFLDTVPVKLLPVTSEDLEHIEDNWLDTAFEDRLISEGDCLNVITGASLIVQGVLGASGFAEIPASKFEAQNSNAAASYAAATALAPVKNEAKSVFAPPVFEPEKISEEIPVLPENPTDAELRRYAENHPRVKLAMRIFRAKIVSVEQRQKTL